MLEVDRVFTALILHKTCAPGTICFSIVFEKTAPGSAPAAIPCKCKDSSVLLHLQCYGDAASVDVCKVAHSKKHTKNRIIKNAPL